MKKMTRRREAVKKYHASCLEISYRGDLGSDTDIRKVKYIVGEKKRKFTKG
jgi:hypothetical protein